MPEKINFTMAAIAKLNAPETGRRTVYDTKSPGLCLMITAAGAKSFYVYKKVDGRPERIRIGGFPDITVDTAREEATKINADIASGVNPAESKRKRRGELTMGQLFELYLEFHAIPHKKSSSVATDQATWKRYMASWEGRKLSTVDDNAIRTLHGKIGKTNGKYAANRLLALLSRMFTEAIKHREWKLANPCRGVKSFAEKSRDRFLQPEEIPRFMKAVDGLENQQIADAFRLMLFTGARKGNVLAMRWEELNLATGTWRVPDTKANEPQLVHLPDVAVAILKKLKEAEHKQSPFVFPSRTAGAKAGCLQDVTKSWNDVREAAGLPGLRMHDLRRSLGSWMVGSGASLQVIGKTLGHHDPATTLVYARMNLDPVRAAVNTAVASMMAAGKPVEETAGEQ